MKKNFCKLMALVVVALMMMSTIAFAAPSNPEASVDEAQVVTVNLTGLTASEEATILVVKSGVALADVAEADIIYIDQTTVDAEGNVTFTMDATNGLEANGGNNAVDIYCGYTSMTGEALQALNVELVTEVEVEAPEFDMTKTKVYAKAYNLEGMKRIFIKLADEAGLWTPAHSNENSKIFYSTEREGYDGLVETTATDVAGILAEITWTKEVPATELTISMYGDVNMKADGTFDGKINLADIAQAKQRILGKNTFVAKQWLAADATNDGTLNLADIAGIKKYILTSGATPIKVTEDK